MIAMESIFINGTIKSKSKIIMPNMPTTFLIDDIHLRNSSTVSEVKFPMIGIKLLSENFAVLINNPSEVCVNNP